MLPGIMGQGYQMPDPLKATAPQQPTRISSPASPVRAAPWQPRLCHSSEITVRAAPRYPRSRSSPVSPFAQLPACHARRSSYLEKKTTSPLRAGVGEGVTTIRRGRRSGGRREVTTSGLFDGGFGSGKVNPSTGSADPVMGSSGVAGDREKEARLKVEDDEQ
ncbi:hypothetical protein Droror1_Dr00016700 [Drosera rotundifolia]